MPDVDFQGLDTLLGIIHRLPDAMAELSNAQLGQIAFEVFAESQREVPRRTGALAGSGTVQPDDEGGWDIGYGGSAAGYALWVHEDLEAHHTPPTKAKYLEDPFNAAIGKLEGALQGSVEAAIVGQYPQQPSAAAGAATKAATRRSGSTAAAVARAHPMTTEEIHSALANIRARAGFRRSRG